MKHGFKEEASFYKTSKFDAILIGLVLFFSVVSIFWFTHRYTQESSSAKKALIYQNNNLLEQVELDKDKTITLFDGRMQIEVKAGKIKIIKSDCPQHICVNMGWIKYSGQTIVCAPNKVAVEIKSTGSPLIDAVVY